MKLGLFTFSVGKKLFVSFFALILLLGLIGGISMYSEKKMQDNMDMIMVKWLTGVEIANNVNYLTEHALATQLKIMITGDDAEQLKYMDEGDRTLKTVDSQLVGYAATYADDEDKATAEALRDKWEQYKLLYGKATALGKDVDLINGAKDQRDQIVQIMSETQKVYDDMQKDMDKLVQINHQGAVSAAMENKEIYHSSVFMAELVMSIAVVVAIIISLIMNVVISRPIKRVSESLRLVSGGDLTVQPLIVKQKDEIGTLVRSVNDMTANLKATMFQINQASSTVAASSEELLASSEQNAEATQHVAQSVQDVAVGASRQQHSAIETGRAMEEMSTGIQRIAETSSAVSDLTVEASRLATEGNHSIATAVERMNLINGSVGEAGAEIRLLEAHSQEIGEIISLIGDIASQTSLLSLNASIEAARAGEQGRGFAVVAGEVKKLSAQSAASVQNISEVIARIQADTLKAVQTMDRSQNDVRLGIQAVADAEQAFARIAETARQVSDKVQEVAAAAEQMAAGSEQVTASVQDMSTISGNAAAATEAVAATTEQQLASVQEITSAAQALSAIALELSDMVGKFKV